ncbi:CPXCG motif-containing cysteine-rich protein [Planctomicrobium piriforme]|uniref:CPXCG motif-containing cysteine-rich protein n=1 Tax=Planctomicrobium piriforme TaxID=1576369 RepID=UPI0036F20D0A
MRRIRQIDRHHASHPADSNGHESPLPHRTDLIDQASYICDSCREEFSFPVDISDGADQQVLEKCPICCHENTIQVSLDNSGRLTIRGDQHING